MATKTVKKVKTKYTKNYKNSKKEYDILNSLDDVPSKIVTDVKRTIIDTSNIKDKTKDISDEKHKDKVDNDELDIDDIDNDNIDIDNIDIDNDNIDKTDDIDITDKLDEINSLGDEESINLIIDDREQDVIPLVENNIYNYIDKSFKTIPINYIVKRFNVGDYLITYKNKLLAVFERKTLKDYASSFKDGRHLNKKKLLEIRKLTGCDLYYIIEGPLRPDIKTKFANIPYKNILSSINNLRIIDKIHIVRTLNKEHTIEELGYTTYCYSKKLPELVGNTIGGVEELESIKLTPEQKMQNSIRKAWSEVYLISDAFSTVLMNNYTLKHLCTSKFDDNLRKLKLPSGRTPPAKAFDNIQSSKYIGDIGYKIIGCCPGISKATANLILVQGTLPNIANMSLDEMKKLKINKKLLGPAKATQLYTFLNTKY